MMLFKSITYIQHAQKNFLKASCLHLCSNYLSSSFNLLKCKRSLCWLQGDQESLKLVAAVWFFQTLMTWKLLIHVCFRTPAVSLFYKLWAILQCISQLVIFFSLGCFAMPLQRLHCSPYFSPYVWFETYLVTGIIILKLPFFLSCFVPTRSSCQQVANIFWNSSVLLGNDNVVVPAVQCEY